MTLQKGVTIGALLITCILLIKLLNMREQYADPIDCTSCAEAMIAKGGLKYCNLMNPRPDPCDLKGIRAVLEADKPNNRWPARCKNWKLECKKPEPAPATPATPTKSAECFSMCGL